MTDSRRVQRSFWLTPEAANRLDQLHLTTGRSKSDLLCDAILSTYVPPQLDPALLQQATAIAQGIVWSVLGGTEREGKKQY